MAIIGPPDPWGGLGGHGGPGGVSEPKVAIFRGATFCIDYRDPKFVLSNKWTVPKPKFCGHALADVLES